MGMTACLYVCREKPALEDLDQIYGAQSPAEKVLEEEGVWCCMLSRREWVYEQMERGSAHKKVGDENDPFVVCFLTRPELVALKNAASTLVSARLLALAERIRKDDCPGDIDSAWPDDEPTTMDLHLIYCTLDEIDRTHAAGALYAASR